MSDSGYDVTFGLLYTDDSSDLTELAVRSQFTTRFPGIRSLPQSF